MPVLLATGTPKEPSMVGYRVRRLKFKHQKRIVCLCNPNLSKIFARGSLGIRLNAFTRSTDEPQRPWRLDKHDSISSAWSSAKSRTPRLGSPPLIACGRCCIQTFTVCENTSFDTILTRTLIIVIGLASLIVLGVSTLAKRDTRVHIIVREKPYCQSPWTISARSLIASLGSNFSSS